MIRRRISPPPRVAAADETGGLAEADLERWASLAAAALVAEGVRGPAEMGLVFVDEAEIAALNEEWMGSPGPTDVLSFPIDDDAPPAPPGPPGADAPRLVGDVVICDAVARSNARARGASPERELAVLVVHGVLHLLGWDHAEQDSERAVFARQDELVDRFFGPSWTPSTS
jgi:probable rRNA maturation factor